MKKRLMCLAVIIGVLLMSLQGISIFALADDAAVTDGFEADLLNGNQPESNGTYTGSLFNTTYIANILEPCYSSSPTSGGANAIAIEDGIGVDGSAGMRMTTTTNYKDSDDVRPVYQYTRAFDLTGGKEMIYGMQFKFNAVPANVNGRLLSLFFSDGTSKTESNVITFNHYQFTCGSNTYRYNYRSDGVEYIGNNRWFTLEALIKTSGTSYTVTSSLKDYTGNIVLTGETTGTVQNADYFKNVRMHVGTARGYISNGEALGFEMVIDNCSALAYIPSTYSSVEDGFEADYENNNQPESNGTYTGSLFNTTYIANILEPCYSSSPTSGGANAIAIEDGIGVDGSAGMRMTTTTNYKNSDDVRPVYQYTRAFDLTGGKEMIYSMQFKFNAVPANVNGRLLSLFFSDGTSKTESNVITFNHYQFTCGSNTYRYNYRSDGVEYIGNNRWFTLEALIKTSGTSYTVTSYLKDYTGNIVLTGETTGTVQNADYFKNVRMHVGTARGYAVNGEPLGFEMVIDDCGVATYVPSGSNLSVSSNLGVGYVDSAVSAIDLEYVEAVSLGVGVSLYEADDNTASVSIAASKTGANKVRILLNERLDSGKSYVLNIQNITNSAGAAADNIAFSTAGISVVAPQNVISDGVLPAGTYTFEINNNGSACDVVLLVAVYKNESSLTNVYFINDIDELEPGETQAHLVLSEACGDAEFAKLFICNNMSHIMPLCPATLFE